MTREQARDRLLDYAYGELSPAEAAEFEAVLRDDPDLQAELDAITMVQEAASGLPRPDLPGEVRGRILMAARSEAHKRAMARRWAAIQDLFLSPIFLGATAIIAAVGVGVHLILTQGTEDPWSRVDREQRVAVMSQGEPSPAATEAGTPPGAPTAAPARDTTATLAQEAAGKQASRAGEEDGDVAAARAEPPRAKGEAVAGLLGLGAGGTRSGAGVLGLGVDATRSGEGGGERPGGAGGTGQVAARPRAQARAAEPGFGDAAGAGFATGGTGRGGGGDAASAAPAPARIRADDEVDALLSRAMPAEDAVPGGAKAKSSAGPARAHANAPVATEEAVPDADKAREAADRETYKEEEKALAKDDRGRFAAPPPASAPVPSEPRDEPAPLATALPEPAHRDTSASAAKAPAPAPAAAASAPASAKRAEGKAARVAPEDPDDWVAEARSLRAGGYLRDALDAYRRALTAGPTGSLLADALAEAAEVAKALGRTSEADGYLSRLERLPDGPARAAKIRAK